MKSIYFILLSACIIAVSCFNPARDNPYDPENPDKVKLSGIVYNLDGQVLEDAKVALIQRDQREYETTSDNQGYYEFSDINPGVYLLEANAFPRLPVQYPADLPAGTDTSIDICFVEAFFDFENENIDTPEPTGFRIEQGDWRISSVPSQGHVYMTETPGGGGYGSVHIDIDFKDCYFESMFMVDTLTVSYFNIGLLFRYQDDQNYYCVMIFPDHIKLVRVQGGSWHPIVENWQDFYPGNWYTIGVDYEGNDIQVYLNNNSNPLFDEQDAAFSNGIIGLFFDSEGGYGKAYFDDVYIDIR